MPESLAEEVNHVLCVLYGLGCTTGNMPSLQVPPPSEDAHQQAINWLITFQESEEAWAVFSTLLVSSPENVIQYYAANSLYAKVRSDWLKISQDAKEALYEELWNILASCCERCQLATIRRICLALSTCVILSKGSGALTALMSKIDAIMRSECSETTCIALVEVLRAIPDELEGQHITGFARERLLSEMRTICDAVLGVLTSVGALVAGVNPQILASILGTVDGWAGVCSIAIEEVCVRFPQLFEAILFSTCSIDEPVTKQACMCLETCLASSKASMREARIGALVRLLNHFLTFPWCDHTKGSVPPSIHQIYVLNAVSKHECEWLVGDASLTPVESSVPLDCFTAIARQLDAASGAVTIAGAPVGLGVLASALALQALANSPLNVVEEVLDFFAPIQAIPLADRHPFFRKSIFRLVLQLISSRIAYPATENTADEDLRRLRSRHSAVLDPLNDCFDILQGDYITELMDSLLANHEEIAQFLVTQYHQDRSTAYTQALEWMMIPSHESGTATWQHLEAVIFCFSVVSRDLADLLEDADLDVSAGDAVPVEYVSSLIMALCSTVPPGRMAPALAATAAKWMGSVASWISFAVQGGVSSIKCSTALQNGISPGVEAAIVCLPPAALLEAAVQFLTQCLSLVELSRIKIETLPLILHYLGCAPAKSQDSAGAADDEDEDSFAAFSMHDVALLNDTGVNAAKAMSTLLKQCRRAMVRDPTTLLSIVEFVVGSIEGEGLPFFSLCPLLTYLADAIGELEFKRLQGELAGSGHATEALRVQIARCIAFLLACLNSATADPGGITGMGDLAFGHVGTPISSPLQFLVEETWPVAEFIVEHIDHADELLSSCFLYLQKCTRCCWGFAASRLPTLLQTACNLFRGTLLPSALEFCEHTLAAWAIEARQPSNLNEEDSQFSREDTEAVASLVELVTGTVALVLQIATPGPADILPDKSFVDNTEAATSYASLMRKLCELAPAVVFVERTLTVVMSFIAAVVQLWDRQAMKSAASLLLCLCTTSRMKHAFTERMDATIRSAGQVLMSAMFSALVDDRSNSTTFSSISDCLRTMLEYYGEKGATEALRVCLDLCAEQAQHEDAEALGIAATDVPRYVETGMGCLAEEDRRGIALLALQYACNDVKRFKMLVEDIAKLAKRATMKDALLSHLISQMDFGASGRPARQRRLRGEDLSPTIDAT